MIMSEKSKQHVDSCVITSVLSETQRDTREARPALARLEFLW